MCAGYEFVRCPEGFAALEEGVDVVCGEVFSGAVAGFVRGLEEDVVVFACAAEVRYLWAVGG